MIRIGINGFGRIGTTLTRICLLQKDCQVVMINDLEPNAEQFRYLLKYDSHIGSLENEVSCVDGGLVVDGKRIEIEGRAEIQDVPWEKAKVDIIIDASGVLKNLKAAKQMLRAGRVQKIIVTHQSDKEGLVDKIIIPGINEHEYQEDKHHLLSASICDAHGLAHILRHLNGLYGINSGFVTTLHPWLSYQRLLDGRVASVENPTHFWSDFSLGRASSGAIIPKNTTAASAVMEVLPELQGKLKAHSYRVPTSVVCTADMTLSLQKNVSKEDLIRGIEKWAGTSKYVVSERDYKISVDYRKLEASCSVDLKFVEVLGGGMVKVVVWYDNEWGYSCRVLDLARIALPRLLAVS